MITPTYDPADPLLLIAVEAKGYLDHLDPEQPEIVLAALRSCVADARQAMDATALTPSEAADVVGGLTECLANLERAASGADPLLRLADELQGYLTWLHRLPGDGKAHEQAVQVERALRGVLGDLDETARASRLRPEDVVGMVQAGKELAEAGLTLLSRMI